MKNRNTTGGFRTGLLSAGTLAGLLCTAAVAYAHQTRAQSQPAQPAAPSQSAPGLKRQQAQAESGLETPWDVGKILADLQRDTEQLQPLLSKMNPQQWYDLKGAPTTYIPQWQTAQIQLKDVTITIKHLSQKPETLSAALDVYFRLEALETTARSLEEGAQRYADRATADQLSALIANSFNNRERFRDYLRDLAASTEQNFKIADEEAQRCRGMISKEPPPSSTRRSKRY